MFQVQFYGLEKSTHVKDHGTDKLQHFSRQHRQKIGHWWVLHEEPVGFSFLQHAKHQLDGFLSEMTIPLLLEVSVTLVFPLVSSKPAKLAKMESASAFRRWASATSSTLARKSTIGGGPCQRLYQACTACSWGTTSSVQPLWTMGTGTGRSRAEVVSRITS